MKEVTKKTTFTRRRMKGMNGQMKELTTRDTTFTRRRMRNWRRGMGKR
jgi:hypothetical protein